MGIVNLPIFTVVEWMNYTIIERVICYEHSTHYVVHDTPCCSKCRLTMQSIMKGTMIDMFYDKKFPSRYFLNKEDAESYQTEMRGEL